MHRALRGTATCFALVALVPTAAAGQSVADIVERMYAEYERQAAGIDNYTLVQSMIGIETVSYFEKETVDGRPVFRMREAATQGFNFSLGDEDTGHGDIFLFGPDLVEHGRYAGEEQIDGSAAHVLAVDDLSALDIAQPSGPGDMEFVPRSGRIFVDAEMMVPRRMEFTGDATTPDGTQEITMRMDMEDFRDVEGLVIPHRTVMNIEGFGAMIDPEMQAQLAEMERQLAALPADQRQILERMLGPQMEQIRQMMAGGGGAMTTEITVTDVRVNAGPPNE